MSQVFTPRLMSKRRVLNDDRPQNKQSASRRRVVVDSEEEDDTCALADSSGSRPSFVRLKKNSAHKPQKDSSDSDSSDSDSFFVDDEDEPDDLESSEPDASSEDSDDSADSDNDPPPKAPPRTRAEILDAVDRIEGWHVMNDVVYRKALGKHTNDGRKMGSYKKILVPELRKVIGSEAMNYELEADKRPVFFEGLDVHTLYSLENAGVPLIGCLCTQTPTRGKIETIVSVVHTSGIVFMMGKCCAHNSSGRNNKEDIYVTKSDAAGLALRMCLPVNSTLLG